MEEMLGKATSELFQYGLLGAICILLIVGIVWILTLYKHSIDERNAMYEEKFREIEEAQKESLEDVKKSQREMFDVFKDTVASFKQLAKDVGRQTDVFMDVRDQVNKVEWELSTLIQKVDKIQEKQDKQYGRIRNGKNNRKPQNKKEITTHT